MSDFSHPWHTSGKKRFLFFNERFVIKSLNLLYWKEFKPFLFERIAPKHEDTFAVILSLSELTVNFFHLYWVAISKIYTFNTYSTSLITSSSFWNKKKTVRHTVLSVPKQTCISCFFWEMSLSKKSCCFLTTCIARA